MTGGGLSIATGESDTDTVQVVRNNNDTPNTNVISSIHQKIYSKIEIVKSFSVLCKFSS